MIPLGNARVESVVSDDPRAAPGEKTYHPPTRARSARSQLPERIRHAASLEGQPASLRVRFPGERPLKKEPPTA